ncbi:MAG: hypothetical protein WCE79_08110 [Xanthobacteraceae bacterium]
MRRFRILAGLALAAALPVAAHTFGLVPGSAPQACLTIGNTTYRLAGGDADVAVRIDPSSAAPGLRIKLAETPEEADFVLVDDGAAPHCRATTNVKEVSIAAGSIADLTVRLADGSAPADYRIYVRSRWITPQTAAALFAAAHMPPRRVAGRHHDRSN